MVASRILVAALRDTAFAPAAASWGTVSPGELPRCAGTDPLQPQPTSEDPDQLYSTRAGEVAEHRQRIVFQQARHRPLEREAKTPRTSAPTRSTDRPQVTH